MPDLSSTERSAEKPVTALGIIAQNLDSLKERAGTLGYGDAVFSGLLEESSRLAGGVEPYTAACTTPASTVLAELAADTARQDWTKLHADGVTDVLLESEMLSGHVEGQLLKFLVGMTGAKRILEIGLFTGYSALAMAEALPDDGTLVACELDAHAARFARTWFDRSPHGRKIRVDVGPALDTLERMRASGERFDFVFIDADKPRYVDYFDLIVGSSLLDSGGLICVDNTMMQGDSYRDAPRSPNGRAIADFNRHVARDPRVEQVMIPIRDGLTLIRRASPPSL